ncbi:MAG: Gx transporter family protein [Erysipelotrichaceae bacterium]|nr:Gx transporter family protein [Erysipelotrichaceae bacterium]
MNETKKMMNITMLVAIGILFHLIESMIVLPIVIPGFKLGLANIIGLITLYRYDNRMMFTVNLMRVFLASLMRGILFSPGFWLSLCGVTLSTCVAIVAKKHTQMSIFGVSCAAASAHVIGQMMAVSVLYQQLLLGIWMPSLLLLSIPTGLCTGYLANEVIKRIHGKERV